MCSNYAPIFLFSQNTKGYYLMKKSEHIESRLYSRNIKIIYLRIDPNFLRFSRFFSGFCPDFAPILSSKDLPRSQFSLTKDSDMKRNESEIVYALTIFIFCSFVCYLIWTEAYSCIQIIMWTILFLNKNFTAVQWTNPEMKRNIYKIYYAAFFAI